MPTINASKYGYMVSSASGTGAFSNLRNSSTATGTVINQPTSTSQIPIQYNVSFSGKGDAATLRRQWWAFNVSAYSSGYTITNLFLQFDPTTNTSTNFPIAVIKSTAQGNADTNLSDTDWNNLDFNTLYSDNSSANYWPDTNSISTIELNSTAISAFSTGYLKVCIVWWFDYTGVGSLVTANGNAYQNFSYTPRIIFSAAASGYPNKVNSIVASSGNKINSIIYTDVNKVNSVD
tara:strand:+ start:253 stop:954 length:702 start_codon:yes stop_codon:yes gene_type:complete